MAWRLFAIKEVSISSLFRPNLNPNPNPNRHLSGGAPARFPPFLNCRLRKKLRKKAESPRNRSIQPDPGCRLPQFESLLHRDARFRFISRTKAFLSSLPGRRLPIAEAGKLHRELGFPRGRKLSRFAAAHPVLLAYKPHLAFTPLMDSLLEEESEIMDRAEPSRVLAVRKLLMLSARRRIPLAKLHHCRALFGLPDDFRDRVRRYPDFFRVAVDPDGRHVLELVEWDPALAVSALERDFVSDETRVRKTFKFAIPHGKSLPLEEDEEVRMNSLTTLPLVSPYLDGSGLKPWSLEAEKYRVGVIHEFLNLTLEKRAWIHHIVEFKEEFSLTRHTYQMLLKQPRAFYLAGTAMTWAVFLRDAYNEDGTLKEKDPQVVFNEKLQHYATLTELDASEGLAVGGFGG